ncbi:MAG TPA: hypothetical protein VJ302_29540, partial [Blastocatellia bacterium]|nr:hypothetical protein [Blastocatellia bacterium]
LSAAPGPDAVLDGAATVQRRAEAAPVSTPLSPAHLMPGAQALLRLQRSHGNVFVQRLIQRELRSPAPAAKPAPNRSAAAPARPAAKPAAKAKAGPKPVAEKAAGKDQAAPEPSAEGAAESSPVQDPRFQGVMQRLGQAARQSKVHEPASKKVADASAASVAPANDRSSRAQANQVEVMDRQEAEKPKTDDFLTMLRKEIARIAPKNMEETEDFKKEGKAAQLKGTLTGQVDQRKDTATQNIEGATKATPDPDRVEGKETTPLPPEPTDAPLPALRSQEILPQPKPEAQVSVEGNKKKANRMMAENEIDEEQLENANEPKFDAALSAKQELETHADQVPGAYRQEEQSVLKDARAKVAEDEKEAKGGMKSRRAGAKSKVLSRQEEAKKKEEEERKKVADQIEGMYVQTRKNVEEKLNNLDREVNRIFDDGEKAARDRFENYVDRHMADYKRERYDRLGGSVLWAKDKLFGLPDEVNRFYEEGRDVYLQEMDAVLVRIADTVETRLKEAKTEIAEGKKRIHDHVGTLSGDLKKAGQESEKNISAKFDELSQGVDAKKKELAEKMARRYQESRDKLNERIKELQAENKGLVDAFLDKLKEIIEILRNFKRRISSLLGKAGDVIFQIVKHPIKFLGHLLDAVKLGFNQFSKNILTHLKAGLLGWLFGALSGAGIEIPSEFSVKSIFGLVLQILGITKDRIRAKVAKLIGEKNVERIEKAWELVSVLIKEGPAGLWSKIKEYLGDFKEMVLSGIREWVITQIVKQAVIWLISLFNPASALLKAIQAIYGVVTFFIERIEQILQLVEAIVESVAKIVAGNIAAAANWIEQAMARTVPVIISFLANLLGLGGISEKVKSIIQGIQQRVDQAIDKVIAKIVAVVKRVGGGLVKGAKGAAQKVMNWLKLRKTFKAGNESHSLYFEGTARQPQLMVASTPEHIGKWINRRKSELEKQNLFDAGKKAAYDGISADLRAIGKLVYSPDPKKIPTQEQAVEGLLSRIAANARILGFSGDEVPVPRMVVSPGFSSQKASNTVVKFLFNDPANHRPGTGTTGRESLGGAWEELTKMGISRDYWKSGHLLNADFGGLAVDSNLIPIPQAVNKAMDGNFDSHVRGDLYQKKKVTWMRFTIARNHPPDVKKHFVSYFKAEAAEMPLNNNEYATPSSGTIVFEKSGGDLPYPALTSSALTLNAIIKAGDRSRDSVRAVAKATQLGETLVTDLVRNGVELKSVDEIEAFINAQAPVYGRIRTARYLAKFHRVKARVVL